MPSTEKKFDDTAATARRAGTPLPVKTTLGNGLIAAMPVNEWIHFRQSTKFAGATDKSGPP